MLTQEQINALNPGDMIRHRSGCVAEYCGKSGLNEDDFIGITVSLPDDYFDQKEYSDWRVENCELVDD